MTEFEEAKEKILDTYPGAYDIVPETSTRWFKEHYEGIGFDNGFNTWVCPRTRGVFVPRKECLRVYRFSVDRPSVFDENVSRTDYHRLIITDCIDPKCSEHPHKLCAFR